MNRRIIIGVLAVLCSVAGTLPLRAQYSSEAFALKKLSELYDERGFGQSKAISVDGSLVVSNGSGNVSYSYPLSSTTASGYPVDVTLNYCGSVAFTTFKEYELSNRSMNGIGTLYQGWERFEQNRPAWIIGVNGFAVQVLSSSTHFRNDRNSQIHTLPAGTADIGDEDLIWAIDGYDFCNRMIDFGAGQSSGQVYVDAIKLLRADGSLLELLNVNSYNGTNPDNRNELYTGYYYANEANHSGFGIVEYDSTFWGESVIDSLTRELGNQSKAPLVPRRLRYYPGDGLEYLFRERVYPYGTFAYHDTTKNSGGWWGHPTIFYLEAVSHSGGELFGVGRARHYDKIHYFKQSLNLDSTRGRAITTDIGDCKLTYGTNSLVVEALGRTTKIKFDRVMASGNAVGSSVEMNWMPIAMNGGPSDEQHMLASTPDANGIHYRSYVGYVTEIIDPEGRTVAFEYEPYTRTYQNFGFPRPNGTGTTNVTLENLRLKKVIETDARQEITYNSGTTGTIAHGSVNPDLLNNVVKSLLKRDKWGGPLVARRFNYVRNTSEKWIEECIEEVKDTISGSFRQTTYKYRPLYLPDWGWERPQARFTELHQTIEQAAGITTLTIMKHTSDPTNPITSEWGNPIPIARPTQWYTPYLVLPSETTTWIDGIKKSYRTHSYDTTIARTFGGNASLTLFFGKEALRRITRTYDPNQANLTPQLLRIDTTTYLHIPYEHQLYTRIDTFLQKIDMMRKFRAMKAAEPDPIKRAAMKWEELMYHPDILTVSFDTTNGEVFLPPIYNLELSSSTVDAAGNYLGGSRSVRSTAFSHTDWWTTSRRGNVLSDTIIGRGGTRRVLGNRYDYVNTYGRTLPTRKTNANGSITNIYYNYSLPEFFDPNGPLRRPRGIMLDNRDDTLGVELTGGEFFGASMELPLAEQQIVRRVPITGGNMIFDDNDTLTQFYQRSFHGVVTGSIDPNGWYSQFDYDRNGRLQTAWLPYDFQTRDTVYHVDVQGTDSTEGYGVTKYRYIQREKACKIGYTPHIDIVTDTVVYHRLYTDNPVQYDPECCPGQGWRAKEGESGSLLRSCDAPLGYTITDTAVGEVVLPVTPPEVASIVALDSVRLRLLVTSVIGNCVDLTVDIPQLNGFTETYVFNCPLGGTNTLSSGGNHALVIDLTSVKNDLLSLNGQSLVVRLKTTTANGHVEFAGGYFSQDERPRLLMKGTFRRINTIADYTLAYTHDDDNLTTTVRAKVDDERHTASLWNPTSTMGDPRRAVSKHYFDTDDHLVRSELTIGNPHAPQRIDTVRQRLSGQGQKLTVVDQERDSVRAIYDDLGRPTQTINADGTSVSVQYLVGDLTTCGITDNTQDFFGFCSAAITTDENGTRNGAYRDAFDRLRREIADLDGLALTTKYEYDVLGRLTQVTNPAGHLTTYTYDDFGRVKTKSQPDLGTVSYAYDAVGNVRFSQTEEQAANERITFSQYDDANRLVVSGEAHLDNPSPGTRLTQQLGGNYLHLGSFGSGEIVTVNPSLWATPSVSTPTFWALEDLREATCELLADTLLGETETPVGPFMEHAATQYQPSLPHADTASFEDITSYPQFVRIAVSYDRMPEVKGAVWGNFPEPPEWDALAPRGAVRNLKGREAAVAYREHDGEPFHYAVMSYDERGRVEALMRWTENLGFDAVYYTYNSMNQVTSVRVADPLRQFTTWYGYNFNGQIDSVWTLLEPAGSGLGINSPDYPVQSLRSPNAASPDILYSYTKTGRVDTMLYPPVNVLVDYAYNQRKWLDSLVALQGGSNLFKQVLTYDSSGQIVAQRWKHGAAADQTQNYGYDALDRLTNWAMNGNVTGYTYDAVGNRATETHIPAGSPPIVTSYTYNPMVGPNRLDYTTKAGVTVDYNYDNDGAVTGITTPNGGGPPDMERLTYSWRGLLRQYELDQAGIPHHDWRYRYSASGEREQKRLYYGRNAGHSKSDARGWVYYLLGGDKEQLAVYHGQEEGCTREKVVMYPVEYLSYGNGDVMNITTRPDLSSPFGIKQFKIADHLGSTRVTLEPAMPAATTDYEPFGEVITGLSSRKGYIDREEDRESGLGDFGVRKYDGGRFLSVDPLWEKFTGQSPYNYSENNPLLLKDPNGKNPLALAQAIYYIGILLIGTAAAIEADEQIGKISPALPPPIVLNEKNQGKPEPKYGPSSPPGEHTFPDKKELSRYLGVKEKELHDKKKEILSDKEVRDWMKKLGASNPDIGFNRKTGKLSLKNPKTGKVVDTDIPIKDFKEQQ